MKKDNAVEKFENLQDQFKKKINQIFSEIDIKSLSENEKTKIVQSLHAIIDDLAWGKVLFFPENTEHVVTGLESLRRANYRVTE